MREKKIKKEEKRIKEKEREEKLKRYIKKLSKIRNHLTLDMEKEELIKIFGSVKRIKKFLKKEEKRFSDKIREYKDMSVDVENQIVNFYFHREMEGSFDTELFKSKLKNVEDRYFRIALKEKMELEKRRKIIEAIKERKVSWGSRLRKEDRYGEGMDERSVEFPLAFEIIEKSKEKKILDAGCALNFGYLYELMKDWNVYITHFTQSAEKEECILDKNRVSYIFGDLRDMDFKDEVFDKVLCISTLEHVGMDNTRYGGNFEDDPFSYIKAIEEMKRVLKKGGELFLSFPCGKSKSLGWYRILGEREVEEILKICANCEYREKYFYYEGCWYEVDRKKGLECEQEEDKVMSICLLSIKKK